MNQSFVTREYVTQVSREISSSQVLSSSIGSVKAPSLSWEQFILINVEMERLSNTCRGLSAENDSLKQTLSQQSELFSENQRLRHEIELLKMNSFKVTDLEGKLNAVIQENQRMSVQLTEKIQEIESWRIKCAGLETNTPKLALLTSEIDRLNNLLGDKNTEIASLKVKINNYTDIEIHLKAVLQEKEHLSALFSEKSREVELIKSRLVELEKELTVIDGLKTKVAYLSSENDKLTHILIERTKEIDSLKIRINQLEGDVAVLGELKIKLSRSGQDHEMLTTIISEKERELQELRFKIHQIGDVEQKVTLLLTEKERLNKEKERLTTLIAEQTREVEALRLKAKEAEALATHVKILGDDKARLSETIIHKSSENERLKNSAAVIPHLEGRIEHGEREKESLTQVIIDKERIIADKERIIGELRSKIVSYEHELIILADLKSKVEFLTTEKDRLSTYLVEKSREIETLKVKVTEIEIEKVKVSDFGNRLELAHQDIERLNTLIFQKDQEIKELNLKIHMIGDVETKVTLLLTEKERLNKEKERLTLIIADNLREVEALRLKAKEAEHLAAHVRILGDDKARLNETIIHKVHENEDLKNTASVIPHLEIQVESAERDREALKKLVIDRERIIDDMREKLGTYEDQFFIMKEFEDKLTLLANENERINALLISITKDNATLKTTLVGYSDLEAKINLLDRENEHLNFIITEKNRIIEEWQTKYRVLEQLHLAPKETVIITEKVVEPVTLKLSADTRVARKSYVVDRPYPITHVVHTPYVVERSFERSPSLRSPGLRSSSAVRYV